MMFADAARYAAGIACGVLGWCAEDFWAATPADLLMAIEGRQAPDPGIAELQHMMERDRHG